MELTMLGTGNALVTECYNTCFVINDGGKLFMVDGGGGNGVLRQLRRAGIDWRDVHQIFVTHKHIDHLLGIVWMVRMICQHMSRNQYDGEATIYAHDEVITLIAQLAESLLQQKETRLIGDRLHLVAVSDGETRDINDQSVTFFDIHSTKAKQYGFSMGLGDGERLVCCGDEPCTEPCYHYVEGATWLLHEAFCLHAQADVFHPYEKHHSTVRDACALAERLHVENLVLYHTEDKNIERRKELYRAEGTAYYGGNLYVPDDLETLHIR